jgi:hypothetical protein
VAARYVTIGQHTIDEKSEEELFDTEVVGVVALLLPEGLDAARLGVLDL